METLLTYYQNFDFDAVSGGWRVSGLDTDFMQLCDSKFANQPEAPKPYWIHQ